MTAPLTQTRSTCPYYGVGCGVIIIEHDDSHIHNVSGDPAHPANFGKLCTKGATLHLTAGLDNRVLTPWLRKDKTAARASLDAVRPWLLAPVSAPPNGRVDRGRIVCNCLDVAEQDIMRAIGNAAGRYATHKEAA